MQKLKFSFLAILFLCCWSQSYGQDNAKQLKANAEKYFQNAKYWEALNLFQKYHRLKNIDTDARFKMGHCFYETGNLINAKKYLLSIIEDEKKPDAEVFYLLAQTFQANHEYKKAIAFYKNYLSRTKFKDDRREGIKDKIKRCANGLDLKYKEELALVENLGEKVNSREDDFGPVLSPNYKGKLYFSSTRDGNVGGKRDKNGYKDELYGNNGSDIFSTVVINGEWTATTPLVSLLNSPRYDAVLGFNEEGTVMYYFKGPSLYSGQMLLDSFSAVSKPLYPQNLETPINPAQGDRSPYFYNDSTLLFVSNRSGGFGGFDVYISTRKNGRWTTAKNLGPVINSPYDEETPFLSKDGRTLYFSSNNLKSMGGFDIFKTRYDDVKQSWGSPENLGRPINSAGDDLSFTFSPNGLEAFFVSSRKDGFGGKDLLVAYYKNKLYEQSITSVPSLFLEVPAFRRMQQQEGSIVFENQGIDPPQTQSYPVTENFPKEEIITYKINNIYYKDDNVLTVKNIKELNSVATLMMEYPQIKVMLSSHSDGTDPKAFDTFFSAKNGEKVATYLVENGVNASNIYIKGLGSIYPMAKIETESGFNTAGKDFNRRINIQMYNTAGLPIRVISTEKRINSFMVDERGKLYKTAIKGLSYKVQVAALKQRYQSSIFTNYPDAMVETTFTGDIYRYTLGLYQTFSSAAELKNDLEQNGVKDAYVVPYINGVRASRSDSKIYAAAYPDLLNFLSETSDR